MGDTSARKTLTLEAVRGNLAERGGFSSGPPAHPFENAGNPHTMLKTQALARFPLRLSRTGKSAWCSPKIDTK